MCAKGTRVCLGPRLDLDFGLAVGLRFVGLGFGFWLRAVLMCAWDFSGWDLARLLFCALRFAMFQTLMAF